MQMKTLDQQKDLQLLPVQTEVRFSVISVRSALKMMCQRHLDCGGSTPPLSSSSTLFQGGVEPPQSKVAKIHQVWW